MNGGGENIAEYIVRGGRVELYYPIDDDIRGILRTLLGYRNIHWEPKDGTRQGFWWFSPSLLGTVRNMFTAQGWTFRARVEYGGNTSRPSGDPTGRRPSATFFEEAFRDARADPSGPFRDAGASWHAFGEQARRSAGAPTSPPPTAPAAPVLGARILHTNPPWSIFYLTPDAPEWMARAAYRAASQAHHPDRGGNVEDMKKVNAAWDEIKKLKGWT